MSWIGRRKILRRSEQDGPLNIIGNKLRVDSQYQMALTPRPLIKDQTEITPSRASSQTPM
ncbi:hypothetical protein RRF57_008335 [Xylaria bambusicola]|uniref:Uncharacterized protein n=1 Tax=Xylaria bambusicola TaxID=326684 RepID=A0AAN7UV52_9PEZI